MGNLCSWCLKDQDRPESIGNHFGATNSEHSVAQSEFDERTPLIGKSDAHHHSTPTTAFYHQTSNGDSSTLGPLLPSQISNETRTEINPVPSTETAETKMAFIVEGMLSKLIDVGGATLPPNNPTSNKLNSQNDQLKHLLNKSFSSTSISALPDVGLNNLPSLLSGRAISSDICHFVAHTAGELSRLLIDEIKIIHKEDLVVVFE